MKSPVAERKLPGLDLHGATTAVTTKATNSKRMQFDEPKKEDDGQMIFQQIEQAEQ